MLKLWKVQVHDVVELNKLTFRDYDQLLARRKISSYFTDKPLDNHIHIVVKPPKLIHFSLELALKAGFLNEEGNVEYLGKDCIYKATLREDCLCTKDGKYRSFIEFIRVARGLKPDEIPTLYDFHSLIINGMTYWEVRDKIYKFISYKNEDNLFIDHLSIPWSDDLEKRLRQLYAKEDIVDIFWGRSLKDDDTTWSVYIVSRNICHLCKRTENVKEDQIIRFIAEEEGFPNKIRGYPVDVVEACTATPYVSSFQAYQENVKLGSSIGIIESQGTAGTLSAVVSDKNLERIDLDDLKQSFGRIASEAEAYREISEKMCHVIDGHRQNSALARYERDSPYSNNVMEALNLETQEQVAVVKKGKALGILHAAWMTDNYRYAITSPYFAVFEALNVVEIDSHDNITLDFDKLKNC
ncbi:unnamed protein product [Rhizophagus irregularis]|nr:unnamed protein product [Rhizophagus irregularis]